MADTSWTKGPFEYRPRERRAIVSANGTYLAFLTQHKRSKANGLLFSAAPDMAEALAALLREYVELWESGDCGNWDTEKDEVVINARAALAKARGEQ